MCCIICQKNGLFQLKNKWNGLFSLALVIVDKWYRNFRAFRSKREKGNTSKGITFFPKTFHRDEPFHLNYLRNYRKFHSNGKRSLSAHSARARKIPGWIVVVRWKYLCKQAALWKINNRNCIKRVFVCFLFQILRWLTLLSCNKVEKNSTWFLSWRAEENLVVNNKDNRVFMSRNYRSDSCPLEIWCS